MTYMGSDYYTAHAYARAHNIGIELTPETGKALMEKIQKGDIFWESPPEPNGCIPIYLNYLNRRIRFIVDETKSRIITLADRDFASKSAIKQAEALGVTLNLAMASLIMEKVKAEDVIESGKGSAGTSDAKLVVADVGLRVIYAEDSGIIIKIDDYTGPRTMPQHPAVSRHAAERAIQRYDVELTPEVSDMIVERIVTGTDLIDHYQIKSGAMAAITEIAPGKPACIIYQRANGTTPIRLVTVTPMTYHEAHGAKYAAIREAQHEQRRAARRERYETRKRALKKQTARNFRDMRDDPEDHFGVG